MLIQCHACNTKYRLNLEQIPRRKTFVRCKNCGTPIYIDPTEEGLPAPGGGVVPAPEGAPAEPPAADAAASDLVVCPQCQARYRLSPELLTNPQAKLKCSQCQHLFPPPRVERPVPPPEEIIAAETPSSQDAAGGAMPLPNEERMDVLFDDLRPQQAVGTGEGMGVASPQTPAETELGSLADADFEDDLPVPDPDQAYLEAVSFGDDEGGRPKATGGTVSDDQKYKVFMNPDEFKGGDLKDGDLKAGDKEGGEPEIDDLDLPTLNDADLPPPEPSVSSPPGVEHADLPALPPEPKEEGPPGDAPDIRFVREEISGQPAKVLSEKTALMLLAAASVAVLIGAGVWGFWLATASGPSDPFTVQAAQSHNLRLEDGLTGRYVVNRPSGQRLFVVGGEVENGFSDADRVRWIRIRGMAYADTGQERPLAQAFAYAGNVLEDSQLTHWELSAIKAYYGFINGRKELNLEIPSGSKVPYQLVFPGMKDKVERTVAEVVSYRRGDHAVFIDTP